MPLPEFDEQGDLPIGVHQATLDEVLTRFGHGTPQRQLVTAQLVRIYELARATGKLGDRILGAAMSGPNLGGKLLLRRRQMKFHPDEVR